MKQTSYKASGSRSMGHRDNYDPKKKNTTKKLNFTITKSPATCMNVCLSVCQSLFTSLSKISVGSYNYDANDWFILKPPSADATTVPCYMGDR